MPAEQRHPRAVIDYAVPKPSGFFSKVDQSLISAWRFVVHHGKNVHLWCIVLVCAGALLFGPWGLDRGEHIKFASRCVVTIEMVVAAVVLIRLSTRRPDLGWTRWLLLMSGIFILVGWLYEYGSRFDHRFYRLIRPLRFYIPYDLLEIPHFFAPVLVFIVWLGKRRQLRGTYAIPAAIAPFLLLVFEFIYQRARFREDEFVSSFALSSLIVVAILAIRGRVGDQKLRLWCRIVCLIIVAFTIVLSSGISARRRSPAFMVGPYYIPLGKMDNYPLNLNYNHLVY